MAKTMAGKKINITVSGDLWGASAAERSKGNVYTEIPSSGPLKWALQTEKSLLWLHVHAVAPDGTNWHLKVTSDGITKYDEDQPTTTGMSADFDGNIKV